MSRTEGKTSHLLMYIEMAVVIVIIVVLLLSNKKPADSKADFDSMKEAVVSAADTSVMEEAGTQTLKRLYGLDASDYDGVVLYTPSSAMGAEELLLVKLKSDDQMDTVYAAIMNRLDTQLNNFEGYGAEQTELLNSALIITQGNYALLSVGKDNDAVRAAFDKVY
ncbi:MAG: DUF4358 domain-containing protein [Lachnospiraceae bacterium]|nr:DUF4358 domain-containing protein [Lachnospiraceae bacterium]